MPPVKPKNRLWLALLALLLSVAMPLRADVPSADRQRIDKIFGATGDYSDSEGSYRFVFHRTDVRVMLQGRPIPPLMGLQSWATVGSDPHHGGTLLEAALALFEDEVNPIISVALNNGFAVTSVANDYMSEDPRVLFVHVSGRGEAVSLAEKFQRLRQEIQGIRAKNPKPVKQFVPKDNVARNDDINVSALDSILMSHGQTEHGMYRTSMGMVGAIFGVPAGKQMGLNSWVAFAGTNRNAIMNGQIIMTSSQVRTVLQELRARGIYITALHNHFFESDPTFYFVHFWANGAAEELAKNIRDVLLVQMK